MFHIKIFKSEKYIMSRLVDFGRACRNNLYAHVNSSSLQRYIEINIAEAFRWHKLASGGHCIEGVKILVKSRHHNAHVSMINSRDILDYSNNLSGRAILMLAKYIQPMPHNILSKYYRFNTYISWKPCLHTLKIMAWPLSLKGMLEFSFSHHHNTVCGNETRQIRHSIKSNTLGALLVALAWRIKCPLPDAELNYLVIILLVTIIIWLPAY